MTRTHIDVVLDDEDTVAITVDPRLLIEQLADTLDAEPDMARAFQTLLHYSGLTKIRREATAEMHQQRLAALDTLAKSRHIQAAVTVWLQGQEAAELADTIFDVASDAESTAEAVALHRAGYDDEPRREVA